MRPSEKAFLTRHLSEVLSALRELFGLRGVFRAAGTACKMKHFQCILGRAWSPIIDRDRHCSKNNIFLGKTD